MDKILRFFLDQSKSRLGLLLNGKWGKGKTYYIKNKLIPKLKNENIRVYYISLFGVTKIDDVYSQVFSQNIIGKGRSKSKALKFTGSVISTAFNLFLKNMPGGFKVNSEDFTSINFFDLINVDNSVVVFDDIERVSSSVDLSSLLGQINDFFIQNETVKVIFVASEEKIKDNNFFEIKEKLRACWEIL